MTTFADFSSLLQLGVGTGIGLSLFRAPVDVRVARLARTIDAELTAMRGATSEFAKKKRRDMQDVKLKFLQARDGLDERIMPYMIVAVLGAIANLIALILATLDAERVLRTCEISILLFISVGWFVIELASLEVLSRVTLAGVDRELERLRLRQAPSL